LISTAITAGASRVASGLLCLHAVAITPAGSMELVRSFISTVSGLPCVTVRSAPALVLSGPAQRSLTLRPARSPSRLATLYIESSDSFVASTAASIATGWSEPVPGRELHPLKSSAFHGALLRQQRSELDCHRDNECAWFQMVETPASLRSFSAFCPWNHLNTKNAWIPNAHNENVTMRAIMSAA